MVSRQSLILLSLVLVAGCAAKAKVAPHDQYAAALASRSVSITPSIELPTLPLTPRAADQVAPGNLLRLSSNQDAALTGDFRIEADGKVKLPYGIVIGTSDLTIDELQSNVRSAYQPYFRGTPPVKIAVKEPTLYINVQGLVEKPGQFLIQDTASIDDVIVLAGGLQKGGDLAPVARFAKISQGSITGSIKLSDYYAGQEKPQIAWRGGETVFFQSKVSAGDSAASIDPRYVQIIGQVRTPGEYYYANSSDFLYYLVQAGGPTDRADLNNLVLVRSNGTETKSVPFSLEEMNKLPPIQGGDVILVNADNPSELEKGTRTFAPIGEFMGTIATSVLLGLSL